MFVSHVLYKVENLSQSVKKLIDAGYSVHVPGDLETAFHALVWFKKGPYLELIMPEKSMPVPQWAMRFFGYGLFVKRQKKWCDSPQGWCDFGLENTKQHLDVEKTILKQSKIKFKEFHPKAKNESGQTISWYNVVTEDNHFPFLVSPYNIDPRPREIIHPNGAYEVDKVFIGEKHFNKKLFDRLVDCKNWYEFTQKKDVGIQGVSIKGSTVRFEDIL